MADSLLGKPTGKFTQAGRPIIKISKDIKENGKVIIKKGSNVSEISRTIPLPNGKWANIPSLLGKTKTAIAEEKFQETTQVHMSLLKSTK